MKAANIIFAGTPEFALASLQALHNSQFSPSVVLTQPDRPAGRGKKLTASPVKQFAVDNGIEVWQPASLKDADVVERVANLQPALMIVAAYGLLLPQAILDIPKHGCLNVHASLLPRWRGAAPIQQAILHGDEETGISLMQMEAGLDTGPVYTSESLQIGAEESAGELHDRLAILGGELLHRNLQKIVSGELDAEPQDDSIATYAGKIRKRDASIKWLEPAEKIARKIRAYNPVPGANFECGKEIVKCFRAHPIDGDDAPIGTVVSSGKAGIDVACGDGVLRMTQLQRPGKNRISAHEFAAQVNPLGKRLGWLS